MFDTIYLEKPIPCASCGGGILDFQTKEFENLMRDYRIGSVLSGSRILSGIIKDDAYCEACSAAGKPSRTDVYLVVWHSILAGVEAGESQAQARLDSVDRLDLLGWLDEAQRKAQEWRRRFYSLHNELQKWQAHLEEVKKPIASESGSKENPSPFRSLWRPSDEILEAPDPIAKILELHDPKIKDSEWGFF